MPEATEQDVICEIKQYTYQNKKIVAARPLDGSKVDFAGIGQFPVGNGQQAIEQAFPIDAETVEEAYEQFDDLYREMAEKIESWIRQQELRAQIIQPNAPGAQRNGRVR